MKALVIGCGRMGARSSKGLEIIFPHGWLPISHIESLQAIPNVKDIAICDSNPENLDKASNTHNILTTFSNFKEAITEYKPDVISIATRTPIKKSIIEFACANNVKGIYVEKPLANSITSISEIIDIVQKHNVKLIYGVNRRYHEVYNYAKKLILAGDIGDIVEITVDHGASQLLWTHPHSTDLILFFADSSQVVTAKAVCSSSSVNYINQENIVDSDPIIEQAFFKFSSGISAFISRANGLNVRVSGSKANLTVHADGSFIQIDRLKQTSGYFSTQDIIKPNPQKSAMVIGLEQLINLVVNNSCQKIDLENIIVSHKMLFAAVYSHLSSGVSVDINNIPEKFTITGRYNGVCA